MTVTDLHRKVVLVVPIAGRRCAINGMKTTAPQAAWQPVADFILAQEGYALRRFTHRVGPAITTSFEVIDRPGLEAAAWSAGIEVRG